MQHEYRCSMLEACSDTCMHSRMQSRTARSVWRSRLTFLRRATTYATTESDCSHLATCASAGIPPSPAVVPRSQPSFIRGRLLFQSPSSRSRIHFMTTRPASSDGLVQMCCVLCSLSFRWYAVCGDLVLDWRARRAWRVFKCRGLSLGQLTVSVGATVRIMKSTLLGVSPRSRPRRSSEIRLCILSVRRFRPLLLALPVHIYG
ncbi:hypothetical protein EXIGLDRAFT_46987 [Exidia glandulosa HHB12029]|uniref:Uncharacterized protein n=1 Tax=Exidia glandulosa HHB12029 TaxID=1314781 RepID=A0A165P523_EXIGL|nr:hypothetical protein EXIGLDRAFT_46987 [Exidia glandulosa HHB12029]